MKMPPSGYMVYVLIDPRDMVPFYVGLTCRPARRWNQHRTDRSSGAHIRVAELCKLRLKTRVRIAGVNLGLVEARARERWLIDLHRPNLMNWQLHRSEQGAA